MIRYALACRQDHGFEAWFRDSQAFDLLNETGQVACPVCGSAEVRKAVMAPAVRRSKGRAPAAVPDLPTPPAETPPAAVPNPMPPSAPIADEGFTRMRAALRELHSRLTQNAENVGPAFPDQARRMHEGETSPRAIYGTATDDEVRSLVEDGVAIVPIPALPDDRN